jgi:hypothetical protein
MASRTVEFSRVLHLLVRDALLAEQLGFLVRLLLLQLCVCVCVNYVCVYVCVCGVVR